MNAIVANPASFPSDHSVSLCRHSYLVRSLRSSDEAALVDMFSRSSAEDICLRCLGAIKDFPHLGAARLIRSDKDREIALVAVDAESSPQGEIVGVVHLINEPGKSDSAEFDIMVRTDMQGWGIGFHLMKEILAQARARELKVVVGYVAGENDKMLWMASELGFSFEHVAAGVVRITALL
jgi:acetyltransferase